MKKVFLILFLILGVTFLSSCSKEEIIPNIIKWVYSDDEDTVNDNEIANKCLDKILKSIKNNDEKALKSMFSKKAISKDSDLDENIKELFKFFEGDFISYDDWGGPAVLGATSYGEWQQKEFESIYNIKTTKQKYKVYIHRFTIDEKEPDNVGIYSMYIILSSNTVKGSPYWGDDKGTAGLSIVKTKQLDGEDIGHPE